MKYFGKTNDNKDIYLYTIKNNNGMSATLTNYGAILVSLFVPDKDDHQIDVVLGYDKLENYFINDAHFGATIGRNANRIKDGKFILNNIEYKLEQNENNNNLHSSTNGYDKRVWDASVKDNSIEFIYHSPDMDQGFPGNLDISVTYSLTEQNELVIDYKGISDKDTVINLTNHSYFNLSGENNILDHQVWINSNSFTIIDDELIPTGEIKKTENTPMDFTIQKKIGKDIEKNYDQLVMAGGYDHNWVLNKKENEFALVSTLYNENNGILMEVFTDLPGLQMYTGNFIDGSLLGKNGIKYEKRSGVCFETQYFPNSINTNSFKSPITKAGEKYKTRTSYKFSIIKND